MPPLKLLIPLLVILGLQAAVVTLPFVYWRLQTYMGPVNKFLLGSFLIFIAFVIHPLILIGLITFTIAPTILSLRHDIVERVGIVATALMPQMQARFPVGVVRGLTKSNWMYTLLGGYAGWKVLGTLPTLVLLGLFVKRGVLGGVGVEERGMGVRSERTDVQVVG